MQLAKIIKGPHVLFVGGNGHKTTGVQVESLNPREGYLRVWEINDYLLRTAGAEQVAELLGLTVEQAEDIIKACGELQK